MQLPDLMVPVGTRAEGGPILVEGITIPLTPELTNALGNLATQPPFNSENIEGGEGTVISAGIGNPLTFHTETALVRSGIYGPLTPEFSNTKRFGERIDVIGVGLKGVIALRAIGQSARQVLTVNGKPVLVYEDPNLHEQIRDFTGPNFRLISEPRNYTLL